MGIKIMQSYSSTNQQQLIIEVTDEKDPFFVYTLEIQEQDFHIIK